ncbi:multicopper oxidase domain-containing protein [Geodermatophilus sp. YIM 151500]|uniref:multicopper oxidase family protein n=1 Tax=Geodermatophilus sp. YIM 151500 TaxID=2984531 RepID=UPI0021E4A5BD|nr:multicopper oxidase domain-containing protein [Geodermatophilus sp. YIM 151500]MCV2488107.1 multicopper oxidase domain-containing protein [Geodermatophilus sp. YIM 151500]
MTAATTGAAGRVPTRRRRRRITRLLVAALVLVIAGVGVLALAWSRASTDTTGRVIFDRPLAIPPLAPSRSESGTRVFDLRAGAGTTDFGVGDGVTRTWGFDGAYLGPTLRAERGERVRVDVTNDLGESTTVHWHGHELPAEMDGGPHQAIEPGQTWSPTWTIDQPAATTWYHPHPHGRTAEHVHRGLAGMFLVDDDDSRTLDLPSEYGVDDIPVIVQDKAFTADGQFDHRSGPFSPTGVLGDTVLVNGTIGPYLEVDRDKVRLRLLNASGARIYDFGLVDDHGHDREFAVIAGDGGLLPSPVTADRIRLSPGERAEIVVGLQPGRDVVLRSHPTDLGADFWNQRFSGGDDRLDVLQLRAADRLVPGPDLPGDLGPPPDLDPADAGVTRAFRLGGTSINGLDMDVRRIDHVGTAGETELWEVTNAGGTPHDFHVHGVRFVVADVDGRRPPPPLRGWKDTVYVAPGTTVRLVLRLPRHADPDSPYMFHCHLLQHEDRGMMGQFLVIEPGQEPGRPPAAGHDAHALTQG